MKRSAPAVARNRQPILDVLRRVLPTEGTLLEIGSGTGEHTCFFARAFPAITFQPTDVGPDALTSIETWRAEAELPNIRAARRLDASAENWSIDPIDVIFCANVIHISPWSVCEGLFRGAERYLRPGGRLITYGPYKISGQHTAPSNAEFEVWLKAQDERFGVRNLGDLERLAGAHQLRLSEKVPMPANNFTLIFERAP